MYSEVGNGLGEAAAYVAGALKELSQTYQVDGNKAAVCRDQPPRSKPSWTDSVADTAGTPLAEALELVRSIWIKRATAVQARPGLVLAALTDFPAVAEDATSCPSSVADASACYLLSHRCGSSTSLLV